MNSFNFVKPKPNDNDSEDTSAETESGAKSPKMIDLASAPTTSSKPVLKVSERKNNEFKTVPIKDASAVTVGRKRRQENYQQQNASYPQEQPASHINSQATSQRQESKQSSILQSNSNFNQVAQTPSEIVSEVASQPIASPNEFVDCQINISNNKSSNILGAPVASSIKLNAEELKDLLLFIEEIEYKRHEQEKQEQEQRSWSIAKKIVSQESGNEFLEEHNIFSTTNFDNEEEWVQSLTIVKDTGESEEVSQPLNFYGPQHSWILENWLSQQATSWTVRRYNQGEDQIIYQVSFGFPDQTFLEAEGPSREGAIMAVAEDLLS